MLGEGSLPQARLGREVPEMLHYILSKAFKGGRQETSSW